MSQEKNFAKGFIFKRNPKSPDFVVGNISVKVDEFIAWLKANESKGWVNMKVNTAKSGSIYTELDTWTKDAQAQAPEPTIVTPVFNSTPEVNDDDLPF